ncbi:MAG: tripartite tricarboxylate transporter substrate binding protein BugD [Beijerinckiaceae bacterium]|nr:tripartite tricarboxylate transporter substrate binding protein BugD [Beijerinckiaceae bacterium]
MKTMTRLAIAGFAALAIAGAGTTAAQAQAFPTKPVTMLIPFAAGGPTDVVGRLVGEHMARTLGQPVIIENAVGAAGTLAGQRLMSSAPDGHVILIGHTGTHAAAVSLNPNLKYKPLEDFAPVGLVNTNPIFLTVKKTHPSQTLTEFVTWLKANEKTATNAHAGIGSVSHTTCLLFNTVLGVKPNGVPYRGTGPAMTDLVAGQIDYLCDQAVNVAPQERAGTIRTLAVASDERAVFLPNVPTSTEGGVPGFKVAVWNAMFAPKDTPPAVVAKLNQALKAALADAGVKGKLQELGADVPVPALLEPAGLRGFIGAEIEKWAPIIKASGVRIE